MEREKGIIYIYVYEILFRVRSDLIEKGNWMKEELNQLMYVEDFISVIGPLSVINSLM